MNSQLLMIQKSIFFKNYQINITFINIIFFNYLYFVVIIFIMKTISKNEKNIVNELISTIIDQECVFDEKNDFQKKKRQDLEKYLVKENIEERDFAEIQRLSSTQAGFINNTIRRTIWKKILNVKGNNNILEFITISDNTSNSVKFDRFYTTDQGIHSFKIVIQSNYDKIIELDVHRSIINTILNSKHNANEM